MATDRSTLPPAEALQLAQVKVPLDDADDAFMTRDETGRIPIVIIPSHPFRVRNGFVLAGLIVFVASVVGSVKPLPFWSIFPGTFLALALIALGIYRSFIVRVPEGVNGLLARGGRYDKTIGSGTHIVQPLIAVSHLVTRREIPFDVQVTDAPTSDMVRVDVDALLTFVIDEPFKFVFNIATDDFDEVLQAVSQEAIRSLIHQVSIDEVFSFTPTDTAAVRATIAPEVEQYGVSIRKVAITFVVPPPEFIETQEQRQLAVRQLAQQAAAQALAERRQADTDQLERSRVLAQGRRREDMLQLQQTEAEAQRKLMELEAAAEQLRLARLNERLQEYPLAAQHDLEMRRLKVARALAGNSRAILQLGTADDISRLLLMRGAVADAEQAAEPGAPVLGDTPTQPAEAATNGRDQPLPTEEA